MCTVSPTEPRALVCDIALSFVRSAFAEEPRLAVEYSARPGNGTEVRLVAGAAATFDARIRAAVARANE